MPRFKGSRRWPLEWQGKVASSGGGARTWGRVDTPVLDGGIRSQSGLASSSWYRGIGDGTRSLPNDFLFGGIMSRCWPIRNRVRETLIRLCSIRLDSLSSSSIRLASWSGTLRTCPVLLPIPPVTTALGLEEYWRAWLFVPVYLNNDSWTRLSVGSGAGKAISADAGCDASRRI